MILKPEKNSPTLEDLNIKSEYSGIPYDLVIDGKTLSNNLHKIGKDEKWLENEVQKFGFKPKDALIVTFNGKGEIYCQKKES